MLYGRYQCMQCCLGCSYSLMLLDLCLLLFPDIQSDVYPNSIKTQTLSSFLLFVFVQLFLLLAVALALSPPPLPLPPIAVVLPLLHSLPPPSSSSTLILVLLFFLLAGRCLAGVTYLREDESARAPRFPPPNNFFCIFWPAQMGSLASALLGP